MKRTFIVLCLFSLATCSMAQIVIIDTLKVFPSDRSSNVRLGALNYPLVKSGNQKIDSMINRDIRNTLIDNEFEHESYDSAITKWLEEGIIYVNFYVTYNRNGILSFKVSIEGCGSYCTDWNEYFNYSVVTGERIDIAALIDTTGGFRRLVGQQRRKQYQDYRKQLKGLLINEKLEMDTLTYNWALEFCNECANSFKLERFALHQYGIEIIEVCFFPNVIKSLTPEIKLMYNYSDIKHFLKDELIID